MQSATWLLIDFVLTKRFRMPDGTPVPPRPGYAEFRGSTSYASCRAHECKELGARRHSRLQRAPCITGVLPAQ